MSSMQEGLPESAVGQVKEIYRRATLKQRDQLRAWMRRVLSGEDGNDRTLAKHGDPKKEER